MKKLPIDIISANCLTPKDSLIALDYCTKFFKFNNSILFTSEDVNSSNHKVQKIEKFKTIDDYSNFILRLYDYVESDYVLIIQDDGFITNPDKWTDSYLEYDYIGAPWPWRENSYVTPFGEHIAVGNGGFSLRSKKLIEVPTKVDIPFDVDAMNNFYKMFGAINWNEDGNICVHNRHIFLEQGCKFAPVEVAKYFSHETSLDVNHGIIPFGYHDNLPAGIEITE